MSDQKRVDPFGDDFGLSEFKPSPKKKPEVAPEAIREVSEASGFPSRAPSTANLKYAPPRRRRTGRNVQLNLKVTPETLERFTALADKYGYVFGELLEHALYAFEEQEKKRGGA